MRDVTLHGRDVTFHLCRRSLSHADEEEDGEGGHVPAPSMPAPSPQQSLARRIMGGTLKHPLVRPPNHDIFL